MANLNDSKKNKASKIPFSEQKRRDKKSRAASARKRHDRLMRATGRKELATNYKKGGRDTKKKG